MEEKKSLHQNLKNVADLLWLSQYMDIPAEVQDIKEESSELLSPDESEVEEYREESNEKDENHHGNEEEDQVENASLDVHTNDKNGTQTQGSSQQKASAFHVPKKLALTHYREWEKAFKFINFKKLSKDKYEFDESKTVETIASTNIFDISFKRAEEKAFSLSVILDTGETMELWDELLKNFEQMLYTMSVFSHIYVYYWDTKLSVPVLYTDKDLKTKISERLVGKEKNHLIWIMSDCLSTSWESGHAFNSIAKWSKKSFTSIVQMFPKEMWMGTMLYKGKQAHFHSKLFNPLNNHLQSSSRRRNKEGLKIPVVSFNPYALQSWARVVVGSHKNIISGVVLENFDFETLENNDVQEISSEMRLKCFYSQATPTAQKLAVYMSVLPVDFQVTRILQEVKLSKSDQSHVAEVYLGGLIEKKSLNHKVHYDFYEGVREGLSVNISADEAFELMQNISGFVADHLNVGIDFSALIADPSGQLSGEHIINDESIAFARLASNVMKRKGGVHYDKAKEIDQYVTNNKNKKALLTKDKISTSAKKASQNNDGLSKKLFFSYGEDEQNPLHVELVKRVKSYLEKQGYTVLMETDRLKSGDDWEFQLESDIEMSDFVLFFMTPYSARRPDGYCLNTLSYVLQKQKLIIPIMVDFIEPPLSIYRIQYLDMQSCFTKDGLDEALFEKNVENVLHVLEEKKELNFDGMQTKESEELKPLDSANNLTKDKISQNNDGLLNKLFFSYARDEYEEYVNKIRTHLIKQGYSVPLEDDKPGYAWEEKLEEDLKNCDTVIFFITPHSVMKPNGFCLNELAMALANNKNIIPVMLAYAMPPTSIIHHKYLDMQSCFGKDGVDEVLFEKQIENLFHVLEGEKRLDSLVEQTRISDELKSFDVSTNSHEDKIFNVNEKVSQNNDAIPIKLFFLYAQDEQNPLHVELVKRVKSYLEKQGYTVLMETDRLKSGDDWEFQLESDIEMSDFVLFFMTPYSARRPDGYCLNTLTYTLHKQKIIIPIMVDFIEPPLSISRIQYLDMQNNLTKEGLDEALFEKNVENVLQVIENKKIFVELKPLDFTASYAKYNNIVGRDWIRNKLDNWVKEYPASKILWITAVGGYGKSTLAVYLANIHQNVVGIYFCEHNTQLTRYPINLLKTLIYELSTQIPRYHEILQGLNIKEKLKGTVIDIFRELFEEPLKTIDRPVKDLFFIIDGIDEAKDEGGNNLLIDMIVNHFLNFPEWLNIIITSRPESDLAHKIKKFNPVEFDLQTMEEKNIEDLKLYIHKYVKDINEEKVEVLIEKCKGDILYLKNILESNNITDGDFTIADSEQSVDSIWHSYKENFKRKFGDDVEKFDDVYAPFLEVILAYGEPIPKLILNDILNLDLTHFNHMLTDFESMIKESDGKLDIYHQSLKDWLTDDNENITYFVDTKEGKKKINIFLESITFENYKKEYLEYEFFNRKLIEIIYAKEKSLDNFFELLSSFDETKKVLSMLDDIGKYYSLHNKVNMAIKVYEECLNISKHLYQDNSDHGVEVYTTYLNSLATIYTQTGQIQDALALEKESFEILKSLYEENPERWVEEYTTVLNNLASTYMDMEQSKEALALGKESLEILRSLYEENPEHWAEKYTKTLNNLAYVYDKMNRKDKVKELMTELKSVRKEHNKITPQIVEKEPGRNDSCPCGSGKKYKKCCGKN